MPTTSFRFSKSAEDCIKKSRETQQNQKGLISIQVVMHPETWMEFVQNVVLILNKDEWKELFYWPEVEIIILNLVIS